MVILMSPGDFSGRNVLDGTDGGNRGFTPPGERIKAHSVTVRKRFPNLRYEDAIEKYFNGEAPPLVKELKEKTIFLAITYIDNKGRKQTMCSTYGGAEYPIGIDPETEQLYMERPDKDAIIIDGDPNTIQVIDLDSNKIRCNDLFANPKKYEEYWTNLIK